LTLYLAFAKVAPSTKQFDDTEATMFNLIEEGLAQQKMSLDISKHTAELFQFPTPEQAHALHAKGKVIVMRPTRAGDLQAFNPNDNEPEAA
jgi:hypothetical protein